MANDPLLIQSPASEVDASESRLPIGRTRLALALVAMVGIALELVMMRGLAIRFSSHFAGIVISVGLLGFGAAGSFLTLFQKSILRHQRTALMVLALLVALCIPATWWLSQKVPLDVNFLAWSAWEFPHVLLLELLMVLPFALVGMFIGIALMDVPGRISGHYAADLLGSGVGGVAAVVAMNGLTLAHLLYVICGAAALAAFFLMQWRRRSQWAMLVPLLVVTGVVAAFMPLEPAPAPRKPLTQAKHYEGTRIIYRDQGPLGRIDVAAGPRLHSAPQLSMQYGEELPAHAEIYVDADGPALVFNCPTIDDWGFADYRTAAAPFHLLPAASKVCVLNAGGGVDIGLALYHKAAAVTALELNPQIIRAMQGPLAKRGGNIYHAPGVTVINQEARGFFAATDQMFDVLQFPPVGGFGAGGSDATQESYLYTVESVRLMIRHLSPTGILAITRGASVPPRDELRAFNLAAESLRQENLDPTTHLAMIRNSMFSATVLVFHQAITPEQIDALRAFCKKMSFDLCYLPGLKESESNIQYAVPPPDPFYRGTQALLADVNTRQQFLDQNYFSLEAPTDDRPYFFHMYRRKFYPALEADYIQTAHSFLEVSYVMLQVALTQAVILAAILILLPLAPGIKSLRQARGKTACLGYFLMLGVGFMLLEMGFVQKLVLYLAHPIYAAAVAIASFLVFAGIGSGMSKRWRGGANKTAPRAALAAVALGLLYLWGLDRWLDLTQAWDVIARCAIAALTIAPLAFVMGHLFPLGLQRVAAAQPALVPWSWAINGFASVVASAAAPLIAMHYGFSHVVILAAACYLLAAVLFRFIPVERT